MRVLPLLALACAPALVLGHEGHDHHDHDHHDHDGHDHHHHHDHAHHSKPSAATAKGPAHPEIPAELLSRLDFVETFQTGQDGFLSAGKWHQSKLPRYSQQEWRVDETFGAPAGFAGEQSLGALKKHTHYGLVQQFEFGQFDNTNKDLVFQYEVRFHEGHVSCSGAYVKLLRKFEGELTENTPYVLMFGPDKCGQTNKVHLIVQQKQPSLGSHEEKHMAAVVLAKASDNLSHLYTLVIRKDNTFSVLVDQKEMASGSLLTPSAFQPSFGGAKEMDDPTDSKPADWVEVAKIADPAAFKPEDWDEQAPRTIPDPDAKQPEDWSEEDDGEWQPSEIPNPAYRGKWKAPIIDNPDYKGEWHPRRIPNPHHFVDETPSNLEPITAVAIEILANDGGIAFDNLVLTHDEEAAQEFAELTFVPKQAAEIAAAAEVKREASRAERAKALEEGGVVGMLQYFYGEAEEYINANKLPVFGTIIALVLTCTLYVFFVVAPAENNKPAAPTNPKVAAAAAAFVKDGQEKQQQKEEEEDDDEDDEEEEEEEEEGTKAE